MARVQMKPVDTDPGPESAAAVLQRLQKAGPAEAMAFYSALLEGIGEISAELAQFLSDRIAEDMRTQHEILNCANPADLMHIQMRFLQKAFDQYSAETGKIIGIGNTVLSQALAQGAHRRAKDNTPL